MKLKKLTRALAASLLIPVAFGGLFSVTPANAMIVSAERLGQSVELDGVPGLSVAGPKGTVIFTHPAGSQTGITLYGFESTQPEAIFSASVPYDVQDLAYDGQNNRIFVIGQHEGRTVLTGIDPETGKVLSGPMADEASHPLLAIDALGRVHVADSLTKAIYLINDMKPDGEALSFTTSKILYDSKGPIDSFTVSQDGEFLFVSDGARPQLTALRRSGYVSDQLPLDRMTKALPSVIVPAKMSRSDANKVLGTATALLLADYNTETLTAVSFEPLLRTLSVSASGSIALPIIRGSVIAKDEETGLAKSPTVIASNPDQSSIVVGNAFSTRVLFLTKQGRVLERTGSAELSAPPKSIAVSENGQHVLVTHEGRKSASVLDLLATSSTAAEPVIILQPDGDGDIREVQRLLGRLGYPVGTVDGIVGPLTTSSLRAVEVTKNVDLDIGNLPATIDTLQGLVETKKAF